MAKNKKNKELRTYNQMTSLTPRYVIVAVVTGVILGTCALFGQHVGNYIMANFRGEHLELGTASTLNDSGLSDQSTSTTSQNSSGGSLTPPPKVEPTTTSPAPTAKATTPQPKKSSPSGGTTAPKQPPSTPSGTDIASESICPGQNDLSKTATVLVCMTSFARQYHGLGTVAASSQLMNSAAYKAGDIKGCDDFSHTACGKAFNYYFGQVGYTGNCQGENIAQGQSSPGEVFVAWMNSPTHRDNILNADFDDLGVAALTGDPGGTIWVMHLGGC